jgi:hypothetical protein
MSGGRLRRNRPEWVPESEDGWAYGDYSVRPAFPGTKHPWAAFRCGRPIHRSHGNYTGTQRFMTSDNAKRWVENRARGH